MPQSNNPRRQRAARLRHRSKQVLTRLGPEAAKNLANTLRVETTGGIVLLAATMVALIWANSPWSDQYFAVRDTSFGFDFLHLNLTVGQWATDGLLAIFFFVVGLELKYEFVAGELRSMRTAALPMVAAVGGMVAPAGIYVGINALSASGNMTGWAIPTATDIAFAVAVLAVVGSNLPKALRAFLLTLAVVDDLLAVTIIAIFYTDTIQFGWLAASLAVIGVFAFLTRHGAKWWILIPLGVIAWAFMHASGVHATIAGVLLGFVVPAFRRPGESETMVEVFEHRWRPLSAGFAIPVFALFASGVALSLPMLSDAVRDPVAVGTAVGLVAGKPVGILIATFSMVRLTRAELDESLSWWDIFAVACLGGIGFTVSLLISELAFGMTSAHTEHVKAAILIGSVTAAIVGGFFLARRNRHYAQAGTTDDDID